MRKARQAETAPHMNERLASGSRESHLRRQVLDYPEGKSRHELAQAGIGYLLEQDINENSTLGNFARH